MSLTKSSPAFERMMEEQREHDDLSYQRFQEEEYLGVPVAKADRRSTACNLPKTGGFPASSLTQEKKH
jgi:hypothetical protein